MKKGLTLLTNSQAFADDLTRRRDGDHEHQRIQGSETARTAIYPNDFAKAVVKAFDAWRNYAKGGAWSEDVTTTGRPPRTNFLISSSSSSRPADARQAHEAPLPIGGEAISFKGKVNPTIAGLPKRVHQNLGHPPNRELVRHLKIGGANKNI